MTIHEVRNAADRKEFLEFPLKVYINDPFWVRPLDKDIEAVFDPAINNYFTHGAAIRWLLKDNHQQTIGRVAAFINHKSANSSDQPTGGMGFFECLDNSEAAFMLLNTCKQWLRDKGMEAMDGPINFGEKDKWWGLQVEGFAEPTYTSNYNPKYYQKFFEDYGFKTYYEQFYYQIDAHKPLPPKYEALFQRIMKNPDFRYTHIEKDKLNKYAEDFRIIFNKAWVKHEGFKEISSERAQSLMKTIKPIMDPELIWFAYYKEDPIGFFIMLPELNQVFKYLNGKLDLMGKLKFLYYRWRGKIRKIFGVVFGVIPEFQGKGMESILIISAAKCVQPRKKYDTMEMTWIGDFNPKMIHLVESLGAVKAKTYITYRKLFDETKEFKRAPIIN